MRRSDEHRRGPRCGGALRWSPGDLLRGLLRRLCGVQRLAGISLTLARSVAPSGCAGPRSVCSDGPMPVRVFSRSDFRAKHLFVAACSAAKARQISAQGVLRRPVLRYAWALQPIERHRRHRRPHLGSRADIAAERIERDVNQQPHGRARPWARTTREPLCGAVSFSGRPRLPSPPSRARRRSSRR